MIIDIFSTVISVVSIFVALISVYLAYRANVTGKQSISTLNSVRAQIEADFDKIRETNEDTQSLITRIRRLFDASEREGLEMVFPNRMAALMEFIPYIQKESCEVVIVGSSLLGLLLYVFGFEEIVRANPHQFRVILTHPEVSRLREGPEGRDPAVIQGEIVESINRLAFWGVPVENIQLYKGSPTVFMIATAEHMLLNPYPYGTEAYRCFCLQFSSRGAVFSQYYEKHYKKIWDSAWVEKCTEFLARMQGAGDQRPLTRKSKPDHA